MFLLLLYLFAPLHAKELREKPAFIFAAGNLEFVFPQIIEKFYQKYPNKRVYIQYGSSGYLADKILEGKEYDIYFAADIKNPQKIYEAGMSATKPKIYAQGALILFVPSNPDLAKKRVKILHSKNIQHITIANPDTAIYGAAAVEVLKNSHASTTIMNKIRYSLDVGTAIDNVIWHGDAGFLSKSALCILPEDRQKEGIDWIEIDQNLYSPILQSYVISKNGLKNDSAMKFLEFINSKVGQKIFQENGYKVKKKLK